MLREKIGEGRTAEIFKYDDQCVVKLFKDGMGKSFAMNEHRILTGLHGEGIFAPNGYKVIEIDNRYGVVCDYVKGTTMLELLGKSPLKFSQLAKQMAYIHYNMQKEVKLDLEHGHDRLIRHINATDMLEIEEKQLLTEQVMKLPKCQLLCHGDLHPDNIMLYKNDYVIIDWESATLGHPLADVARTSLMFKYGTLPDDLSLIKKKIIHMTRKLFLNAYLNAYIKLAKCHKKDILLWEPVVAAARLVEGIPLKEKEQLKKIIYQSLT